MINDQHAAALAEQGGSSGLESWWCHISDDDYDDFDNGDSSSIDNLLLVDSVHNDDSVTGPGIQITENYPLTIWQKWFSTTFFCIGQLLLDVISTFHSKTHSLYQAPQLSPTSLLQQTSMPSKTW